MKNLKQVKKAIWGFKKRTLNKEQLLKALDNYYMRNNFEEEARVHLFEAIKLIEGGTNEK